MYTYASHRSSSNADGTPDISYPIDLTSTLAISGLDGRTVHSEDVGLVWHDGIVRSFVGDAHVVVLGQSRVYVDRALANKVRNVQPYSIRGFPQGVITHLQLELCGGSKVTIPILLRVISHVELLLDVSVLEFEDPSVAALPAPTLTFWLVDSLGDCALVGGEVDVGRSVDDRSNGRAGLGGCSCKSDHRGQSGNGEYELHLVSNRKVVDVVLKVCCKLSLLDERQEQSIRSSL